MYTKKTLKWPETFKFLQQWRNFAKSGQLAAVIVELPRGDVEEGRLALRGDSFGQHGLAGAWNSKIHF